MNQRFELYIPVHKGLRYLFSKVLPKAGQIDYSKANELQELEILFNDMSFFLKDHAHNEETYVLSVLEEKAPHITQTDLTAHEEIEANLEKLEEEFKKIKEEQENSKKLELGLEFYRNLSDFISDYLKHMLSEEITTMDAIWENFEDPQIIAMFQNIIKNLSPEAFMKTLSYMIPAINHYERLNLLMGVKSSAPPEVFQMVLNIAQNKLSQENYSRIKTDLK